MNTIVYYKRQHLARHKPCYVNVYNGTPYIVISDISQNVVKPDITDAHSSKHVALSNSHVLMAQERVTKNGRSISARRET